MLYDTILKAMAISFNWLSTALLMVSSIGLVSSLMPNHKLVVVVLDGFSPSYLGTFNTTHIESVVHHGGGILKNITPEFPASRLPYLAALANGRHSLDNKVLGPRWCQDLQTKKVVTANDDEFWHQVNSEPLIWVSKARTVLQNHSGNQRVLTQA